MFITFEGGDGAGKSSHATRVVEWLRGLGHEVVQTREPGGTELGQQLRNIVLHGPDDLSDRAEALIFAADRAHHIQSLVRPALERGAIVVQDRYLDSSIVYQGRGRGLGSQQIRDLSVWAADGLMPDLTVLLDLKPEIAMQRMRTGRGRLDRLESLGLDFHLSVREQFLQLAQEEPERIRVVDADRPERLVSEEIRALVAAKLEELQQA
ncbi:dTMP kinase [Gulosibacter sp. ACHW.36C]|uniref:Thymidylate kinase n=1 Tax=Gulosibacter sediminis TaxID=1729695 RepID=A0ABY4MVN4_9MICO|nr:dTMP kinase [Gulosibacter sediminis]UQN14490.1 dTMP kinase [Gulosibacter sediminis]